MGCGQASPPRSATTRRAARPPVSQAVVALADLAQLKRVTVDVRVFDLESPESPVLRKPSFIIDLSVLAPAAAASRPDTRPAEFKVEKTLYLVEFRWVDPPLDQSYRYEVARGGDKRIYVLQQVPLFACTSQAKELALDEAVAWASERVQGNVREYVLKATSQTGAPRAKGK